MSTPGESFLGAGSHYNLDEISLFDMSLEDDCLIPLPGKKEPNANRSVPQQYIPETRFMDTRSMVSSLPVIQENAVSNIAEEAHLSNVDQMDSDTKEEAVGKKKKKKAGVNLRKSLAWNNAFLTEEGVLDTEELSLVNPTFHLQPDQAKQTTPHQQQQVKHDQHFLQHQQVHGNQHLHQHQQVQHNQYLHQHQQHVQHNQPSQHHPQQQTPVISSSKPSKSVLPSKMKTTLIPSIKGTPTVESQQSRQVPPVRSSVDFSGFKRLEFNNGTEDEVISKRLSVHPLLSNTHVNLLKKDISAHSEPLRSKPTFQKGTAFSGSTGAVTASEPSQGKLLSQLKPPTQDTNKQARQSAAALKSESLKRPSQFENTENPKKPSHADGFGRLSKPSGLRMPSPKLGFFETTKGGSLTPNESIPVRNASGIKAPSMSVRSRQASDMPTSNTRTVRASSTSIPTIPANRTADVRLSRSLLNLPTKDSSGQILQVKNSIPSFSASTKSASTRDIAGQENLYPQSHDSKLISHKFAGDQTPKGFSNNGTLRTFQHPDN